MLGLFNSKPVIDEQSMLWIFDAYDWALRTMNADMFFNHTDLITPSNKHFPEQVENPQAMAELIFEKVKGYAGLTHWPCQLVDAYTPVTENPPRLLVDGVMRSAKPSLPAKTGQSHLLAIPYAPSQIAKPEVIVSSFAHVLGHYMSAMTGEMPPGGRDFWSHANDFLVVFFGFGLMLANTAYTYKGGCGSCYNPSAERTAFLSQDEAAYALAIFAELKNIPDEDVSPFLKKYLRPVYKKARKDLLNRQEELQKLRQYQKSLQASA